ncbi:hypothetical protein MML48_4g00008595 [Holotrichia oblita]|uniref:Uncharacterized protein n=1 Tax=Holotrichia oblita TaxID=644536 RepID=A0ACB9T9J6_HOLOL|nr:hypothetical protein MML48_4g00008595 [Holotrichia oblita]
MLTNKDESDQKNGSQRDGGKTRKNRSKLLANMIMKAKEKIRNNSSSSNNQTTTGGSVTCLYDIRNKSGTSQSSKSKACVDSDSHFDGNIQSQPNFQEIDGIPCTSKDSSGFKLAKEIAVPSNEPPPQQNLQERGMKCDLKNIVKVLDQTALIDSTSALKRCTSMAYVSGAVKEMLDFKQRLENSESHLLDIVKKYVKDNTLEKELTDIITNHVTLQIKAERHAQNLTNDMWVQQAQFYKSQEKMFNESLKEIMNHNKKLQDDNDALTRKNEKLYIKIALSHEESNCLHEEGNIHIIEHLSKNNERLRHRNIQLVQKSRLLEKALEENKEEVGEAEKQLQHCLREIQNHKRTIQTMTLDKELETAVLQHKIEANDKLFQNAIQQGESIIEEISTIKQNLPSVFSEVNWRDLQRSGNILQDIFMACKLYIKEMASYIAHVQNNISCLEEDNQRNTNECLKLREALDVATVEVNNSIKQSEIYGSYAQEKEAYIAKINILQKEFDRYKQVVESKTQAALGERAKMIKMIEGLELLKIKIGEKDEELRKTQHSNETLKHQIHGLNRVLQASGAGEVAKELVTTQERLSSLQSLYHQTVSEKNCLVEKMSSYSSKVEILSNNEVVFKNKIADLENEAKTLNDEKCKLKEEIATQKATLNALQAERKRHLEEKTFLKTVYDKVKSGVTKTEELESTIQVMNKETSRLTVIAEYNKQLGDKLQAEIRDRDAIINELQQNIQKLSEMQKMSIKEKAALCEELTEVCSFKDILSNKLEDEISKNAKINESRKVLETNAVRQLESLRSFHNVERNAVKKLLTDFNDVLTQRNKLQTIQKEHEMHITRLEDHLKQGKEEIKILNTTKLQNEKKISSLDDSLRETQEKLVQANLEMDKWITKEGLLREDNEKLQQSVAHLKQNLQNMQSTVDGSKSMEVDLTLQLKKRNAKMDKIKEELNGVKANLKNVKIENADLLKKLDNMKLEYDDVLADYLNFKNDTTQTANLQQNKLRTTEAELERCTQNTKNLEKEYHAKVVECENLSTCLKTKETEYTALKLEKDRLEKTVEIVNNDKENLSVKLMKILSERESLRIHSLAIQEKITEKEKLYDSSFEELSRINEEQVTVLKNQIEYFKSELMPLKEKLVTEKKFYAQLEESHKDLAAKLLKSVHMLIDEKLARQSAETKISQLTQELIRRETEQVGSEQKLCIYSEKIQESSNKIQELQQQIKTLESETKGINLKYQNQLDEYDKLMVKFANIEALYKEQQSKAVASTTSFENEDRIMSLKCEIDENHSYVMKLQNDIFKLQQDKTTLEFQTTELELRLNDTEKRCQLEEDLKNTFQAANRRTLAAILEMKEQGSISRCLCDRLLDVAKCDDLPIN